MLVSLLYTKVLRRNVSQSITLTSWSTNRHVKFAHYILMAQAATMGPHHLSALAIFAPKLAGAASRALVDPPQTKMAGDSSILRLTVYRQLDSKNSSSRIST